MLVAERLKCGTAGFRRLERSEFSALSAVATTALFCILVPKFLSSADHVARCATRGDAHMVRA